MAALEQRVAFGASIGFIDAVVLLAGVTLFSVDALQTFRDGHATAGTLMAVIDKVAI